MTPGRSVLATGAGPRLQPAPNRAPQYRALPQRGYLADARRRLQRDPLAIVSLIVLLMLLVTMAAAPMIAPYDPDRISYDIVAQPSVAHFLGTDDLGRDILSRLIFASRISLTVGMTVALITSIIGTTVGTLAGYYGGRVDALLSGFVNLMLSIPLLPFAMVLAAFIRTNLFFIVLILGSLYWTWTARLIRAEVLALEARDFVAAARAAGASDWRIMVRHIIPSALPVLIVAATLNVAAAILAESALSYLGYGIQPPTASWGNMLQSAQRFLCQAPQLAIYPGLLVSLTVISINFLGDGLRDALDPRLRRMQ
jgi:peptide/nickel transport system permease protein